MADTSIQTRPTSELSDAEKNQELERIKLIWRTVAAGTTKDELLMFLHQAKKSGLDPLAKQLYIIVRGSGDRRKATIQSSIDGLRLVAERSGKYAGQDEPEYEYLPGDIDHITPVVAKVRIYKFGPDGQRYQAAVGVAHLKEYKPDAGPSGKADAMWVNKPHIMLAKVAEALGLRKAFPQDLSGIYSEEETAQVIDRQINKPVDPPEEKPPASAEDAVLSGDTVDAADEPPAPSAADPLILAYEKKIMALESDGGLKIVEGEITGKTMTPEQRQIITDMIHARRSDLATAALGTK